MLYSSIEKKRREFRWKLGKKFMALREVELIFVYTTDASWEL